MQALILAAGMGSRLGKHTKDNTKCMLKNNGFEINDIKSSWMSRYNIIIGKKI